jgi:CRP-like cAMP-binding protein
MRRRNRQGFVSAPNAQTRLRSVFDSLADIPAREWDHFWSHVREHRFATRQYLFREAGPAPLILFILSGLVRLYHNEDGRELVRGFDYEDRFIADYESVLTGCPASFSVQALEPVHALAFPAPLLETLYARHPCWDRVGRRMIELQWLRQVDKERRFRLHSPEAHYRALIARQSPLIDRVPLNQLASFLRITPETLSRIRARLRDASDDPAKRPAAKRARS